MTAGGVLLGHLSLLRGEGGRVSEEQHSSRTEGRFVTPGPSLSRARTGYQGRLERVNWASFLSRGLPSMVTHSRALFNFIL